MPRTNEMPTLRPREELFGATTTADDTSVVLCTPFALPSDGVVILGPSSTLTLTADALFTPACTSVSTAARNDTDVIDMQDPFYASVTPQVYATGAATVIAWMLVIMLLITPRTFFVGGAGGRSGLMGRRGMISGATGGTSVIGVGSRPWLQKIAALTVAISMTIATADTFRVAEQQYKDGYMDATVIRQEVVGGLEIKISRLISDIFLLLAQVQSLIRLFPRHKEKVIIKWVGFALIILDMTFSSINNFMGNNIGRPRQFKDAIPALSYLFELALSMLYAAWVLYYGLTKRRYAFYHRMMYNISIIALLSIIAVLTPVVFFATDISDYSVAGWGDYFRWVGAAAASVIVWEWVERIEALEREDKKDGILGREIFDGDEMLDITPSEEINWPGVRHDPHQDDRRNGGAGGVYSSAIGAHGYGAISQRHSRLRGSRFEDRNYIPLGRIRSHHANLLAADGRTPSEIPASRNAGALQPPPPIATPTSRTDTTSAGSTLYAVRYHPVTDHTPTTRRRHSAGDHIRFDLETDRHKHDLSRSDDSPPTVKFDDLEHQMPPSHTVTMFGRFSPLWKTVLHPFRRRRTTPPPEILGARVIESSEPSEPSIERRQSAPKQPQLPAHNYSRWDFKGRLGAFVAEQSERLIENSANKQKDVNLPITVIPAQPRGGRTWSPDAITALSSSPVSNSHEANHTSAQDQDEDRDQGSEDWTTSSRSAASSRTPRVRTAMATSGLRTQGYDAATSPSTLRSSPSSPNSFGGPLHTPPQQTAGGPSRPAVQGQLSHRYSPPR